MNTLTNEIASILRIALKDDIEKMGDIDWKDIDQKKDAINPLLMSIYFLIKGRYNIETSWDYETTYRYYKYGLSYIQKFLKQNSSSELEKMTKYLYNVLQGHIKLQEAEAHWTLCNFRVAERVYFKASDSFESANKVTTEIKFDTSFTDVSQLMIDYSKGWFKLTRAMNINMIGCSKLREGSTKNGEELFSQAKKELEEASTIFFNIGNELGTRDAKSYIIEGKLWGDMVMLYFYPIEVRWLDFFHINSEEDYYDLLSQKFSKIKSILPSELIVNKRIRERLKTLKIKLGKMEIKNLNDSTLNDIEVNLHFFTQKSGMIEYSYKISEKSDIFFLYLMKILNSHAVPAYEISLKMETVKGESIHQKKARIHDMSKQLLIDILPSYKLSIDIESSHSIITVFDTDKGKIDKNMIKKYPYIRTLLSTSEMAMWRSPEEFSDIELNNLTKGLTPDNTFIFPTKRSIIIFSSITPIWEIKIYRDAIIYLLLLKNEMLFFQKLTEDKIRTSQSLLAKLKAQISLDVKIKKDEIMRLMTKNIELRDQELKILDSVELYRSLRDSPMDEISVFIERLSEIYNFNYLIKEMDSRMEKLEKLYETIYHIGQESLSLQIMINSDISTRAFTTLSIIMFGSLGLSILTATLKTPITYSYASLGVFSTSFIAYVYFLYIKYKVLGVRRHFLTNKK